MRGEGELEPGRPRMGWIDDIRDWTNPAGVVELVSPMVILKRSAENRELW